MQLKWHGTAAVEVISDSGRILFDPFVPLKSSGIDVRIEDYDGFDTIFVTHGHVDHIYNIPEIAARNPDVMIYCTKTPYQTLRARGVSRDNLTEISYGQRMLVHGFSVCVMHGRHAVLPKASPSLVLEMLRSPHRGNLPFLLREHLRCHENDETVFYQIEADGESAAVMGSLNLREEVDYPQNMDLLVLAYNGWTDNYPPAVQVIMRLKPKCVLLDHYDESFPPFTRPVDLKPIMNRYPGLVRPMELGEIAYVREKKHDSALI